VIRIVCPRGHGFAATVNLRLVWLTPGKRGGNFCRGAILIAAPSPRADKNS
jgi:hypothetical protein